MVRKRSSSRFRGKRIEIANIYIYIYIQNCNYLSHTIISICVNYCTFVLNSKVFTILYQVPSETIFIRPSLFAEMSADSSDQHNALTK